MNASPSLGLAQNARLTESVLRLSDCTPPIPSVRRCRSFGRCCVCVSHALTVRGALPITCGRTAGLLEEVQPCVIRCGVVCLTPCCVGPAVPSLRSRARRPANQSQLGRARCPARSGHARLGAGIWAATATAGTTVLLLPTAHAPSMQQRRGHAGGVQLLPSSLGTPPSSGPPCAVCLRIKWHTPSTA
jgi:hypothetical protein